MILSAQSLTHLQSCPRRFLLDHHYNVLKWRPKALLDASLRRGIFQITQGGVVADVAGGAVADFMQAAADPGLDLPHGTDPFKVAVDYCAMLETILRSAARWKLPRLAESPPLRVNATETEWSLSSFQAPDESLHRFVTVDRWDEAARERERNGWAAVGDTAVAGRPMTIHVVEIGQRRGDRQSSPWCRAWKHPVVNKIQFMKTDGTKPHGGTAYYLADHRDAGRAEWVAQMEREGVMPTIIHTLNIPRPDAVARTRTLEMIQMEAWRAGVLLSEHKGKGRWREAVMHRGQCYGMVACPFIPVCYEEGTDPATTGLYVLKSQSILRGRIA